MKKIYWYWRTSPRLAQPPAHSHTFPSTTPTPNTTTLPLLQCTHFHSQYRVYSNIFFLWMSIIRHSTHPFGSTDVIVSCRAGLGESIPTNTCRAPVRWTASSTCAAIDEKEGKQISCIGSGTGVYRRQKPLKSRISRGSVSNLKWKRGGGGKREMGRERGPFFPTYCLFWASFRFIPSQNVLTSFMSRTLVTTRPLLPSRHCGLSMKLDMPLPTSQARSQSIPILACTATNGWPKCEAIYSCTRCLWKSLNWTYDCSFRCAERTGNEAGAPRSAIMRWAGPVVSFDTCSGKDRPEGGSPTSPTKSTPNWSQNGPKGLPCLVLQSAWATSCVKQYIYRLEGGQRIGATSFMKCSIVMARW